MKVKTLINILNKYNKNYEIALLSDPEGNDILALYDTFEDDFNKIVFLSPSHSIADNIMEPDE